MSYLIRSALIPATASGPRIPKGTLPWVGAADGPKATAFIANQRDLIETARLIAQETGRPLDFDCQAALDELDEKQHVVEKRLQCNDADYSDINQLGFYGPLQEEVYAVLDSKHPDRHVIAKARPTIFVDKMEANINQRMRLSGLRITRMIEKAKHRNGDTDIVAVIRAYASTWKASYSGEPTVADSQGSADGRYDEA